MEACSYLESTERFKKNAEPFGKMDCIVHTPSDFAKANLIYLQEIGGQRFSSPRSEEGGKDSYLFFIVIGGRGQLQYDNVRYELAEGYCSLLDCRKPYCCYPESDELFLHYIYFTGSRMPEIYQEYIINGGVPCFRSYGPRMYQQEWQQIYTIASLRTKVALLEKSGKEPKRSGGQEERFASFSIGRDMEMYSALVSLLTDLVKAGKHARASARRSLQKRNVQDVKEYLEKNYQKKLYLDDLSEIFFINKFYLIRLFREQYGTSVNEYLIQIRLSHAKELLRTTKMSIREISDSCGFNNSNYFYKLFRKREGISPGEFQRRNRAESK